MPCPLRPKIDILAPLAGGGACVSGGSVGVGGGAKRWRGEGMLPHTTRPAPGQLPARIYLHAPPTPPVPFPRSAVDAHNEPIKARFWPWLEPFSGTSLETFFSCFLLAQQRVPCDAFCKISSWPLNMAVPVCSVKTFTGVLVSALYTQPSCGILVFCVPPCAGSQVWYATPERSRNPLLTCL